MLENKTNPEIALILHCSARTVDKHREHLYAKLGLTSRPELKDWYEDLKSRGEYIVWSLLWTMGHLGECAVGLV